jgi:hypothetical protein
MLKQTSLPGSKTQFKGFIALSCSVSLMACMGSNVSFNPVNAQVSIDENTAGVVWQAKAQLQEGLPGNIRYKISGIDSRLFTINTISGELTFNVPADFESPLDADKNNVYLVDIEASAAQNAALQHLEIRIKDVRKPTLTLESPRPNENIGTQKNDSIETEIRVRFIDIESNTAITEGSVTLNATSLIQDPADKTIWAGRISVPIGSLNLELTGLLKDKTAAKSVTTLFNKTNAANPSYLGVYPGNSILFFDPAQHKLARVILINENNYPIFNIPLLVVKDESFNNFYPIYTWDPKTFSIFGINNDTQKLKAVKLSGLSLYSAGCLPGTLGITKDQTDDRIIALTRINEAGRPIYRALALPTSNNPGSAFINQQENSEGACTPAITQTLFDLPASAITGVFKYFSYHEASKTYIFADERELNGIKYTAVQGFSDDTSKRFEVMIGPDISNLAINQSTGLLYVAENHSTSAGNIREIDIKSGFAKNAVESNNSLAIGAYTNIQVDPTTNRLYIGDDVSDSIFVADLSARTIGELNVAPVIVDEIATEN